ncbi:hypothetical protein [Streptosporangium sp. NPDC051022]|uniref:hypothetical protein n=1 Tax=Streptosporangium sp. NPDC051022 TaxID=3155752 RepID=UPI0034269D45
MTTVTGIITTAAGGHPRGASVTFTLVDQAGRPTAGFAGTVEVLGIVTAPVAVDGSWSVSLTPTSDITSPHGPTLYQVLERVQSGVSASYYISVPSSGPAWVGDLRVTLPGTAPEQLAGYLPLTGGTVTGPIVLPDASPAASEAYVAAHGASGGGSGHTPQLYSGSAAPSALQIDGDLYLRTGIGDLYQQQSGAWVPKGNLQGPAGPPGASGATGPQGPQGLPGRPMFPAAGYGLVALSGDPENFMLGSGASNNTVYGALLALEPGLPASGLYAAVRTAGTYVGSGTPNQIGLYTEAGQPITQIPNDPALWTGDGWRGAQFASAVPAQDTLRWLYVLIVVGGMSGLSLPYPTNANDGNASWFCTGVGVTRRRGFYAAGTSLPASFNPSSYGTPTTYIPLVGIS